MKKLNSLILFLLTLPSVVFGQATAEPEMADKLRAEGKIYIVVGTILIILIGLLIYIISVDRKITKLEKDLLSGK